MSARGQAEACPTEPCIPASLPPLCIAVTPASARGPAWLPCTCPRAPGELLCSTHYEMFTGVILGFQNRLKLPEHPFVDPRTLKRLYAKTKKTKRTRSRRRLRDSRGTARHGGQACQRRAGTPDHRSAIEHTVTPPQDQNTPAQQEAQTQTAEAAVATRG